MKAEDTVRLARGDVVTLVLAAEFAAEHAAEMIERTPELLGEDTADAMIDAGLLTVEEADGEDDNLPESGLRPDGEVLAVSHELQVALARAAAAVWPAEEDEGFGDGEMLPPLEDAPAAVRLPDLPASGRTDLPASGRTFDSPASGRTDLPASGRTLDLPKAGRFASD